jgi:hypothetical protein
MNAASLCSERGRLRLKRVATSPSSTWQAPGGRAGNLAMNEVTESMGDADGGQSRDIKPSSPL